ncbi:hypothetical protein PMAYCL1PPCAC_10513, partial [Pristionchus mayeri]
IPLVLFTLTISTGLLINAMANTFQPGIMNTWPIDTLDVVMMIFSFHGTVHSAALLATTPAFRKMIIEKCTPLTQLCFK